MVGTRKTKLVAALTAAMLVLFAGLGAALAEPFSAALLQCSAVTLPTVVPGCAAKNDPLTDGSTSLDDVGTFTLSVTGALTDTSYTVTYEAIDGSSPPLSIGQFMTGPKGDGSLRKAGLEKFGTSGAGIVVVSSTSPPASGGAVQFVSGLGVSPTGLRTGSDLESAIVQCSAVTVPGKLSKCGTDPLKSGHVVIDNNLGDLTIRISGAAAKATYTAALVAPNGITSPLPTLGPTPGTTTGYFVVQGAEFPKSTNLSGTVEIFNAGTLEFVSAFNVDAHPVSPIVSASNLVRCKDVTEPTGLDCGDDKLTAGSYQVDTAGKLTVQLTGAEVSTNYEVYLRPLDDSGDIDTGLALPTDKNGNQKASTTTFLTSTEVDSGTFVVKELGTNEPDQYVIGFTN
jgi:hypothetical protein